MLTTIEKVIFLQDVDIFEHTLTEDLAHIALITEEIDMRKDTTIFEEGDIADSMYMVIEGNVRLTRNGEDVMFAGSKEVFGSWALLDDEPRIVTARVVEDCRLLKINKEDFIDLLADHVEISQSIMKTTVKRLRNLMSRAGTK
jgi:CRP-like cAMP-binding protein